MDRAGLVGADGATHCGAFDVAFMACLPNMVVMAPSDEAELINMVATAAAIDDRCSGRAPLPLAARCLRTAPTPWHTTTRRPSCLRFPRGSGVGVDLEAAGILPDLKGSPLEARALPPAAAAACALRPSRVVSLAPPPPTHPVVTHPQLGKAVVRRAGKDVALLGYGHSVLECMAAAELLAKVRQQSQCPPARDGGGSHGSLIVAAHVLQAGVSATVVDARFCKPLDTRMVKNLAAEHSVMLTVEEGSVGGFGAHVMQVRAPHAHGMSVCRCAVRGQRHLTRTFEWHRRSTWRWRDCWMGGCGSAP